MNEITVLTYLSYVSVKVAREFRQMFSSSNSKMEIALLKDSICQVFDKFQFFRYTKFLGNNFKLLNNAVWSDVHILRCDGDF